MKETVKARMQYLADEVNRHMYLYHKLNAPEIADSEYDNLFVELRDLSEQNPDIEIKDNPLNKVGYTLEVSEDKQYVKHNPPMLSIRTITKNIEEAISKFMTKTREHPDIQNPNFLLEYKWDGIAVNLVYKDNELIQASTRGDHYLGEDITDKILKCPRIIKNMSVGNSQIRGELMLSKSGLFKLNEYRQNKTKPLKPFSNCRNAVAGIINSLEPEQIYLDELYFKPYQLFGDIRSNSQSRDLIEIDKYYPTPYQLLNITGHALEVYYEVKNVLRNTLDFDIDGLVLKVDRHQHCEKLGFNAREPNWAIALKFTAQEAVTTILDIENFTGRTGKVTPRAKLSPVKIGGVTVEYATLHNYEQIKRLNVNIGDKVIVRRDGDVIPAIAQLYEKSDIYNNSEESSYYRAPATCDACGSQLVEKDNNPYCVNDYCGAMLEEAVNYFASKNNMDIEGFGPALTELLVDIGAIKTLSDIYSLTERVLKLTTESDKRGTSIYRNIQASRKNVEPQRFLRSIGIPATGVGTAKRLLQHFKSLEKIEEASIDELMNVKDIGPITAQSIVDFFSEESKTRKDYFILKSFMQFKEEESIHLNKKCYITGKFKNENRQQVINRFRDLGYEAVNKLNKEIDLFVAGEGAPEWKIDQAKKLNLNIVYEF